MKILFASIIIFLVLIINPFSSSNGQTTSPLGLMPPSIDIRAALQLKIPLVEVEYQSDSMVVIKGDENTFLSINGTMTPFWQAINIVKSYGYSLDEITTSGMGSQGNPTRFYAIMSKP